METWTRACVQCLLYHCHYEDENFSEDDICTCADTDGHLAKRWLGYVSGFSFEYIIHIWVPIKEIIVVESRYLTIFEQRQFCGSASFWNRSGSGIEFPFWCRSRFGLPSKRCWSMRILPQDLHMLEEGDKVATILSILDGTVYWNFSGI